MPELSSLRLFEYFPQSAAQFFVYTRCLIIFFLLFIAADSENVMPYSEHEKHGVPENQRQVGMLGFGLR